MNPEKQRITLRRWTSILLVIAFVLMAGMNPVLSAQAASRLEAEEVTSFLDGVIQQQMEEHNIPNLTVSLVQGGQVLMAKGYGYADYDTQTPVDPDRTLFRIGSTSKLFTWTAIMQLVEAGKLDLDTDINEYLDFQIPSHLERRGAKESVAPITTRHLMSHTPGFEDYMTQVFNLEEEAQLPLEQHVKENRPARVFAPREVTAYSNYGTSLAGYIVQRVSGMPYTQYVEEHIYRPLGMTNSTFHQPVPEALAGQQAKPYRYVKGEFMEGAFEFVSKPAGSMSSSAHDMARFMMAYLQGGQLEGQQILQEETVQRMFAERFTLHPNLEGMAHGFIKATYNGKDVFQHPGGTMLYDTGLYLIPEEAIGLFISHSGGNYLVNIEVFQQFIDRYFPSEGINAPVPSPGMAERSAAFRGEYYQNRRSFTDMDAALSMMGRIRVDTDEEGYLLVSHMGEVNRFVEVAPGVYYNLREGRTQDYGGDFRNIVFGTDTLGKTMLMADGPMSYSRAAWYETMGLTLVVLLVSLLVILGSLFFWAVQSLVLKVRSISVKKSKTYHSAEKAETVGKQHHNNVPKGKVWARRTAMLLGIMTLILVFGFLVEGGVNPVYQLPVQAYTSPSAVSVVIDATLTYVFLLLTAVTLGFSIMAWKKGYWKLAGRVHYTIFGLAAVVISWMFYFWNLV